MRRALAAGALAAALAWATAARASPRYWVGADAGLGGADAPAGVSAGLSTGISLHETNGFLGHLILAILAAAPQKTGSGYENGQAYDVYEYGDGSAPAAALAGAYVTDLDLRIFLSSLGGDTSGFSASDIFAIGKSHTFWTGMAGGMETMHARSEREVVATGDTLTTRVTTHDVSTYWLSIPFRLRRPLGASAVGYVQLDLNLIGLLGMSHSPGALVHYGVEAALLDRLALRFEVQMDGFAYADASLFGEVAVGTF